MGALNQPITTLPNNQINVNKQVSSLQTRTKLDLQSKNHKLLYSLQYSKKILDFFQESIDSLEKEAC